MILDRDYTKIVISEQVAEEVSLAAAGTIQQPSQWEAALSGESVDRERVLMYRTGRTPDEALKKLFEAMSDAGVTL